jgi:phage terminase large subunit-like protein
MIRIDPDKFPHCYRGHEYAQKVVNGEKLVATPVYHACERYFDDLRDYTGKKESKFYLDLEKAERFLKLAQRFKHVKGEWETPNIKFESWQCFIFLNIYGWQNRNTGSRRFRTAHVEIPRGNGKSAVGSQVGLYHLSLEKPKGNEVYSAATGRDQARIILDSARAMARGNRSFLAATGTRVLANKIVHDATNSFFKALSADSNTLDGLQPACALIDELHAHRNRKVYDVIDSAMSKRSDSLLFVITTAGFDTSGIGYSQSVYAKKVASGEVPDESFFSYVSCPDEDDDPFDPKVWEKVNPNWGVSVDPENFESKALKAKNSPDALSNFLVKHLNKWLNANNPFFDLDKWDQCADPTLQIKDFYGEKVFSGVDLANTVDLTAFGHVFKDSNGVYNIFYDAFIPEQRVIEGYNDSYAGWVQDGHLHAMQGEVTNMEKLGEHFFEFSRYFKLLGVPFDPWSAREFAQRLSNKGLNMVEFRMTTANLSEAMKKLNELILQGKVRHNGSPLLRWCIGNVVAKRDANDNVFPRKENEKLKIDVAIAIIMAVAMWIEEEERTSPYENRGLIVI